MNTTVPDHAVIPQLRAAAQRYASRGWPVFPCLPGAKVPATANGWKDATTDAAQIRAWWKETPFNVAIATGRPGPDVLDVDVKESGSGFPAFLLLKSAGLLAGAGAYVQTRNDGLHVYFRGTEQRCHVWEARHIDFRAAGGYVLAPPSTVPADSGFPAACGCYRVLESRGGMRAVSWDAIRDFLDPPKPKPSRGVSSRPRSGDVAGLAAWFGQFTGEGAGRNAKLWWCALKAGELVAAGKADAAAAWDALMGAAEANGYISVHGAREAQRTIQNGLKRAGA